MTGDEAVSEAIAEGQSPRVVWESGLARGQLLFQRCADCAAAVFFPRTLCPACGSARLGWERSAGAGTVYATTAVHKRGQEPYSVALVDLAEGFRLMTRVVGLPAQEVRIGMAVDLEIAEVDGQTAPVFRPRTEGSA
jgi:uncharacterized OB-fold protein